eukprot:TRINITY_DN2636_c0_g4_i1.p1 TRINITY_DN2636_c0_g4~~TRINITY_DN2636_c0_g4_i1.p1  ORF type:complete len:331 (+),score=52.74 TRINITY_DN2636_c0_g4_i1:144-1136(+)
MSSTASRPELKATHAGHYVLGRVLGSGRSGVVFLANHRDTGEEVAVKVMSKVELNKDPKLKAHSLMEVHFLAKLQHPNVIRLIEKSEDDQFIYIVLDYISGGDLYDILNQGEPLEQSLVKDIFYQLMHAVEYCHSKNICHRDLKPENILIKKLDPENPSSSHIILADFGFACEARPGQLLQTCCGSMYYASPEVVLGSQYDGFKADIWSCGVILYAMLTTRLPFYDEVPTRYRVKLCSGKFEMPPFLPKSAQELLEGTLSPMPKLRMSAEAILRHPWLRDVGFLRSSLLPWPSCPGPIPTCFSNTSKGNVWLQSHFTRPMSPSFLIPTVS